MILPYKSKLRMLDVRKSA